MLIADSTLGVLQYLPSLTQGRVAVYHLDAEGRVLAREGMSEQIDVEMDDGFPVVAAPPLRAAIVRSLNVGGEWMAVTCDAADESRLESFIEGLLLLVTEKEQVEHDMESMQSSSLALLEEVAMVGDLLPRMAGAQDEEDMLRRALESLLVAASAQQALYLSYDRKRDLLRVVLHMHAGSDDELAPQVADYPYELFLERDGGICWRALDCAGGAVLESTGDPLALGAPRSPESLAQREAAAVPVRYGSDESQQDLGVLLLLDKRKNAYSDKSELGSQETKLAASVASMLGSMLGSREVSQLNQEMGLAEEMQQNILPSAAPRLQGFDLAGRCENSGAVGGDYYDFLPLSDDSTMVVIADVSGHNLASGMVMVSARSTLQLLSQQRAEPGLVYDGLAQALFADLSRLERFITSAAVTLRSGVPEAQIVNAGHNPTMVYRAASQTVEELRGEDTVLGFLPSPEHAVQTVGLEPGDVVLLYTDGVTEATSAEGEMFEEERLAEVLRNAAGGSAEEILDAVFGAVRGFADSQGDSDDISAVVIRYVGDDS